jgi:Bardet-Biedl syndrome 9 protein
VKIITGSYQGTLRILYPRQRDFKIEDLMLEEQLGAPILQVECGRFIQNSQELAIAILHPRKLRVCKLQAMPPGTVGAAASYYELATAYEHNLGQDGHHFTAFNMVCGPFGQARGRDLLCVQSLDGQLQIFEQDNYAFTRQFSSCLVPGPLCYSPHIDSIITCSSEMVIECFKYRVLATSTGSSAGAPLGGGGGSGGGGGGGGGAAVPQKKLQPDWTRNVGETVLEIKCGRFGVALSSAATHDIVVLGEHTLVTLKEESGEVQMQHRLSFEPSCSCLYQIRTEDSEGPCQNLIVASHQEQLMIFAGDARLKWWVVQDPFERLKDPLPLERPRLKAPPLPFLSNSPPFIAQHTDGLLPLSALAEHESSTDGKRHPRTHNVIRGRTTASARTGRPAPPPSPSS